MGRLLTLKTQSQLLFTLTALIAHHSFHQNQPMSLPELQHPLLLGVGLSSYPLNDGSILPDGTVTLTPHEFRSSWIDRYVHLPDNPIDPCTNAEVRSLTSRPVPLPAKRPLHPAPWTSLRHPPAILISPWWIVWCDVMEKDWVQDPVWSIAFFKGERRNWVKVSIFMPVSPRYLNLPKTPTAASTLPILGQSYFCHVLFG